LEDVRSRLLPTAPLGFLEPLAIFPHPLCLNLPSSSLSPSFTIAEESARLRAYHRQGVLQLADRSPFAEETEDPSFFSLIFFSRFLGVPFGLARVESLAFAPMTGMAWLPTISFPLRIPACF